MYIGTIYNYFLFYIKKLKDFSLNDMKCVAHFNMALGNSLLPPLFEKNSPTVRLKQLATFAMRKKYFRIKN